MANDGTIKIGTEVDRSGAEKEINGLGDMVKKGFSALGGAASTMAKVTTAALGAAVTGIAAAGTASVAAGKEFETSFAKASTLFGDVAVDTDNLKSKMLEVSNATGVLATDLNESLYSALSAGIPVTEDMGEATAFLESSAKLAKAGFTDMDTALSATAKTLNAYGMDVSEADKIQKILIQTQNKGITTVGELGASLSQVTPTAAAFAVSFDNVGAALSNMTAAGTPTAQATTQLNSLIAELGKQGTMGAKALEQAAAGSKYAGMNFKEMMEAGAPLNEVLDLMRGYADDSGLSMVDLFSSIEAGKAALALSGENSQKFADNLEAMGTSADVVTDAYNKVSDTLEVKTQKILNSAKNLGIGIYNGIQDPLNGLADMGMEYMNQLSEAFTEGGLGGLIEAGTEVVADIGLGIARALPQLIETGTQLLGSLTTAIGTKLPEFMTAGGRILSSLASGLLSAAGSLLTLGGQIIQNLASSITSNLPQIVSKGKEMIQRIGEGITTNLPVIMQSGFQLITSLIEGIAQMLPDLLQTAVDAIIAFALSLTDPDCLLQLINAGIDLLVSLITGITEAMPRLMEAAPAIIANLVTALIAAVPKLLEAAVKIMSSLGKYMLTSIGNLLTAIPDIFKEIKRAFREIDWASIGHNIIDGIKEGIKAAASRLVDAALSAAKSAVDAVKGWLGIASPSKLMRDLIGRNMIAGISVGFDMETPNMIRTAKKDMLSLVDEIQGDAFSFKAEYKLPKKSEPGAGGGEGGGDTVNNYNFYQPVETPDETARAIRKANTFGLAGDKT